MFGQVFGFLPGGCLPPPPDPSRISRHALAGVSCAQDDETGAPPARNFAKQTPSYPAFSYLEPRICQCARLASDGLQLFFFAHEDDAVTDAEGGLGVGADFEAAGGVLEAEDDDAGAGVKDLVDGAAGEAGFEGDVDLGEDGAPVAGGEGVDELDDHGVEGGEGHLLAGDGVGREDAVGAGAEHARLALRVGGAGDAEEPGVK